MSQLGKTCAYEDNYKNNFRFYNQKLQIVWNEVKRNMYSIDYRVIRIVILT